MFIFSVACVYCISCVSFFSRLRRGISFYFYFFHFFGKISIFDFLRSLRKSKIEGSFHDIEENDTQN